MDSSSINLITNIHAGTRFSMETLRKLNVDFVHMHTSRYGMTEAAETLTQTDRKTVFVSRPPDAVFKSVWVRKHHDTGENAPTIVAQLVSEWFYNMRALMMIAPHFVLFRPGTRHMLYDYYDMVRYLGVDSTQKAIDHIRSNPKTGHSSLPHKTAAALDEPTPIQKQSLNPFRPWFEDLSTIPRYEEMKGLWS